MENTRKNPENYYREDVAVAIRTLDMLERGVKNECGELAAKLLEDKITFADFSAAVAEIASAVEKAQGSVEYFNDAYDVREEELRQQEEKKEVAEQ